MGKMGRASGLLRDVVMTTLHPCYSSCFRNGLRYTHFTLWFRGKSVCPVCVRFLCSSRIRHMVSYNIFFSGEEQFEHSAKHLLWIE